MLITPTRFLSEQSLLVVYLTGDTWVYVGDLESESKRFTLWDVAVCVPFLLIKKVLIRLSLLSERPFAFETARTSLLERLFIIVIKLNKVDKGCYFLWLPVKIIRLIFVSMYRTKYILIKQELCDIISSYKWKNCSI